MQCASCLTDLVSSNEIPGYSWITLIIYKKKIMNNENSYRHFSSLKFREKNMKIYRFFKYFPVTLKHLTHSPNKWYSIMKTSSRFKNNGPRFQYQCESSQSYIENIFIFFFLKCLSLLLDVYVWYIESLVRLIKEMSAEIVKPMIIWLKGLFSASNFLFLLLIQQSFDVL